jgi:SpoVK/Ycf46/Vps4 family AAA+-type ATPase
MLVQMFVEAKRHQPSVLYIPALSQWSAILTPTAKATFCTLLDSLTPSEPVIIIAFMDEPIAELDPEIHAWFGRMGDNLIELHSPEDVCACRLSDLLDPR